MNDFILMDLTIISMLIILKYEYISLLSFQRSNFTFHYMACFHIHPPSFSSNRLPFQDTVCHF